MNTIIVNPFGIGDVLFTTPLIHSIKEAFPGSTLGYLCNKRTAPILKENPLVDKVFIYERDDYRRLLGLSWFKWTKEFSLFIRGIRKEKFRLALDLSLASNFGFYLWLAGIKRRAGFNYKNRGFYLTDAIPLEGYSAKHVIEYYEDILGLINVNLKYRKTELYLNENDTCYIENLLSCLKVSTKQKIIAFAPGGGASWGKDAKIKYYPPEKFAELADKVIEKYNSQVIMIGDSIDRVLINRLIKTNNKIFNLAGELTLLQSAALIDRSDLFVGNDGGLLHIAVALGKKTVSFYGPVDSIVYGPYPPDEQRHIILKEKLSCSPCYRSFRMPSCQNNRKCLKSLSVEAALNAIDRQVLTGSN